ncbi:MAG: hydrolase [Marmoricola sp.]|jgi:8-oxo-dGTP diphosphatase|nr:hydrolase [Marmoricola sp.]
MSDYPRIDVTVDVVALADVGGEPHLLVVRRGNPPFEGQWAFPGGYLEVDEDLAPAAARELEEETGLALSADRLRQLGAYGEPGRDPRNRTISVTFMVDLEEPVEATGGDDAADARWRPVTDVQAEGLAFDHARILADALASR